VIDPEEVEHLARHPDPLPPPAVPVARHAFPVVARHPPVLPPFLSERVGLERFLGRSAAGPIKQEQLRPGEHIATVIVDADRHVAHQRHAFARAMIVQRAPLMERGLLHVGEEPAATFDPLALRGGQCREPSGRGGMRAHLFGPAIPLLVALPLDEDPEQRVAG
jgi:hypothetical protein